MMTSFDERNMRVESKRADTLVNNVVSSYALSRSDNPENRGCVVDFREKSMGSLDCHIENDGDVRGYVNRGIVCSYCYKYGHEERSCYKKYGYPVGWLEKYRKDRGVDSVGSELRSNTNFNVYRSGRTVSGTGAEASTIASTEAITLANGNGDDLFVPQSVGLHKILNTEQWDMLIRMLNLKQETSTETDTETSTKTATKNFAQSTHQATTGLTRDQWERLVRMLESRNEVANNVSGGGYSDEWIVDSGASNHMTGDLSKLSDVYPISPCLVGLPNGNIVMADQEGSVELTETLTLKRVLFVKELKCNLVSVSQVVDDISCIVLFSKTCCLFQKFGSEIPLGIGRRKEGLYFLQGIVKIRSVKKENRLSSIEVWHKRLGHASEKMIRKLPVVDRNGVGCDLRACDICFQAKQCRSEYSLSSSKSKECFEMIHCDLWGPYRTASMCGSYYFLTIVDDFSRAVWVFLLADKAHVYRSLEHFFALVSRQFGKTIRIVRSDNGTEFMRMKNYFTEKGIIHQTSCVGTPQQNGRVERKHRHILNVARALMFQANLPIEFWGECVLSAAYLINRTPCELHKGKSPHEIIFGEAPKYDEIRMFGCLAYAHNQKRHGDKFASRSRRCVFLGYPYGKKGWTLMDLDTKEVFVSRDVTFIEEKFPYAEKVDLQVEDVGNFRDGQGDVRDDWIFELSEGEKVSAPVSVPESVPESVPGSEEEESVLLEAETATETITEGVTENEPNVVTDDGDMEEVVPVTVPGPVSEPSTDATTSTNTEEVLGRGKRKKFPSTRLQGFVTNTVQRLKDPTTDLSNEYGIEKYVTCDRFTPEHRAFLAKITEEVVPRNFAEAMKDERWRGACRFEIDALEESGTWSVEPLPHGKKAIGSKWVFTVKYNADGTIERYKARLVALGNRQTEGLDYDETFAPVAKMTSVRVFLQIAVGHGWDIYQMDVNNAFLHGDLEEEVFMKLPQGFSVPGEGMVCRLRKSLYGLKQSPRCWYAKLAKALFEYGFTSCGVDQSLFSFVRGNVQVHVLVYVDDLIITGSSQEIVHAFQDYLCGCFRMKNLGKVKYFLGLEVARSSEGIFLTQRKYTLDIIADVGVLGGKPVDFPMEPNHKLGRSTSKAFEDPEKYRRLVGRLIYLSATRPDLAYSVHVLSQFMHQPQIDHWMAALRVVRYLKGCPGQGIFLKADCDFHLTAWCDSDWAGCPLTRRSLTGWLVQLGGSPVSWRSKKQDVVSCSSAEAEYRAMVAALKELKWVKSVLTSMGIAHSEAMDLYCDSKSALHIAANPVFHERTKHIEVDCHFIRDEIKRGIIQPKHVSTTNQLADVFTKALGGKSFQAIIFKLGIRDLHAPT